jgi:DNA-binding CsgD family transcriptional regulator
VTPAQPRPERIAQSYLTYREWTVLALLAEGLTNEEIAIALGISKETIKSHIKHSLRRLGCRNRAELVNVGWRTGMLPPEPGSIEAHLSRLSIRSSGQEQKP